MLLQKIYTVNLLVDGKYKTVFTSNSKSKPVNKTRALVLLMNMGQPVDSSRVDVDCYGWFMG
jgi:hypothetical protein